MDFNKIYINGEWIDSTSGEFIEVENPANKTIIARVPRGNKEDVDKAVKAAKDAFVTWQFSSLEERIAIMQKVVDGLKNNIEYMAETVVKELGCGYKFSKETHIKDFVMEAENYIKIAKEYNFEKKLSKSVVRREPVGVIGCLTPWNFPLEQIVKKVIPAILAGNCVILKPSQTTPLTAYILSDIVDKAGFPKGVFNLVSGKGGEVGNALASHEDVDMISFTGSTTGGREVSKLAAQSIKKVVLELGGKSATIILKGGDYKLAVKSTLDTVYLNTGQTCNAYTRLLVPKDDLKEVEKLIVEETKNYKFGDPSDKSVDVGPLASKKQFDKVKRYIETGLEEGAEMLVGEIPDNDDNGYYVGPVVFTNVSNDMVIAQEEIFGPVLVVIPYSTEEESIEIANDSIYGLAGAVFGPEDKANEVARKIRTGSIYVNEGEWDLDAPFGGYKHSGIGREGGVEGFEEFLEIKTIYN
ncbi:aldehyde dehydrogenase family protein [Schnuerera sp. xch1]|uniref:aldehyde dehydrogenase family protein n=1 Tax=Schnuerera sp. xch1 TaxID=2874283 RepID=UPI001CBB5DE8|nr:aldehyde dehydrogenase family protein [Schnuerera sp. xch1]MBZ2174154.1 aldehyde dehydrogenase family protein [Schnuerera sp. xch1]